MRKTVHVTRLTSSSSSSFAFPVRASPITTRRCSPTVDRFTYKFNKHISYLMHALSPRMFRPSWTIFLFFYPLFSSTLPARKFFGSSLTSFYSALRFQTAPRAGSTGSRAMRDCLRSTGSSPCKRKLFSRCRYNIIVVKYNISAN